MLLGEDAYSFAGFVKSLFVFVSDDFWSFIGLFVCCFVLDYIAHKSLKVFAVSVAQ